MKFYFPMNLQMLKSTSIKCIVRGLVLVSCPYKGVLVNERERERERKREREREKRDRDSFQIACNISKRFSFIYTSSSNYRYPCFKAGSICLIMDFLNTSNFN